MSMRQVRVMRSRFVVAFRMVLGCCVMVACSVFVVFRCLSVVMGCFMRHGVPSFFLICASSTQGLFPWASRQVLGPCKFEMNIGYSAPGFEQRSNFRSNAC